MSLHFDNENTWPKFQCYPCNTRQKSHGCSKCGRESNYISFSEKSIFATTENRVSITCLLCSRRQKCVWSNDFFGATAFMSLQQLRQQLLGYWSWGTLGKRKRPHLEMRQSEKLSSRPLQSCNVSHK